MELGLGLGRRGLRGMGVLRSGGGGSLAVASLRGTRPDWGFQGGGGGAGEAVLSKGRRDLPNTPWWRGPTGWGRRLGRRLI